MSRSTDEAHLPGLRQPVAANDGLDAPFWEGTKDHELKVQQCDGLVQMSATKCNRAQRKTVLLQRLLQHAGS